MFSCGGAQSELLQSFGRDLNDCMTLKHKAGTDSELLLELLSMLPFNLLYGFTYWKESETVLLLLPFCNIRSESIAVYGP